MNQQYESKQTVSESKFNILQTHIATFKEDIKTKYSKEILDGSESYHMLAGSSVIEGCRINPDPLFKEVNAFVRETLSLVAVPHVEM